MATALYRRYRPESFTDVIGQDHVTTPLKRALRAGRIGHAYLFSGPRGCGKTTSARILARCLNCAEGPTDEPCGTCDSCRDLARDGAGSLDVVEIDAASHGGVDDARELRERATFAPVRDRFKVFIIDEAHMVTSAGFNALLKLVEEPPEHVKFVFATTEPDKVIGTIRSRTHHYPFRLIPPQVLTPYLESVCAEENVQVGEGVLPLVVRAGGGSARDTLSVLDQLMAGASDQGLDYDTAINLLGFTDTTLLDQAVESMAQRNADVMYTVVERVLETGHEPRRFVEDLLERVRDLIVLAAVPGRGHELLPEVPADALEAMVQQASMFVPADLSLIGDLIHETLSTMSGATSPRLHLELLAARLVLRDQRAGAVSAPPAPGASVHQAAAPAHTAPGQGGAGQGVPAGGAMSAREEARRIAQQRAEESRRARQGERSEERAPAPAPIPSTPAPAASAPAPSASASSTSAPSAQAAPAPAASDPSPEPMHVGRQERPASHSLVQHHPSQGERASQDSAPTELPPSQEPAAEQGPSEQEKVNAAEQEKQRVAEQRHAPAAGFTADDVRRQWSAIIEELHEIRRPAWALVRQNAHVHGVVGQTVFIGFGTQGLVNAFYRATNAQNLTEAMRRVLKHEVVAEAVVGEDPGSGNGPATPSGGPSGGSSGGSSGGPSAGPSGGASGGPHTSGSPSHVPQQRTEPAAGAPRPEPSAREERPDPVARAERNARHRSWGEAAAPAGAAPGGAAPAGAAPGGTPQEYDGYPPYSDEDVPPEDDALPPYEDPGYQAPTSSLQPATAPEDRRGSMTSSDEIPEVQDEGRDSLPAGEARTYGQAALKKALEEDRVVRSIPAQTTADPVQAAPTVETASSRVVPALSRVERDSSPAEPASSPADAATSPAMHGAALARAAVRESREQAQQFGSMGGRGRHTPAPQSISEEEDPTGGASRDDADATYTVKRGREVVEQILGGKVLEVIDEMQG